MEPGVLRDALTLVLGLATGVMSALFGVGGAVVSTPGIRALGASAVVAVGTTLPSIIPGAISGTSRYVREGFIRWRVVRWAAPFGIAASVGGSLLSKAVPGDGHWLMVLTAALLGWTAWRMAKRPDAVGAHEHVERDSPSTLAVTGAAAGLLSGLLGVGGGIVMVPAFSEVVGLPLKTSIATSLACVAMFAVPGTITHAALGDIDWRFALLLAAAVVPGARLGAHLTIRTADERLRTVVAVFLGAIAIVYAVGELVALR